MLVGTTAVAVVLTAHAAFGVELALALPAVVLGGIFYWDARNRSMGTAEIWGVLIAGLFVSSVIAGIVALVGYLGARPDRPGS
jgi:hypothetical protein